jgi:hypothetical protein
MYGAAVRRLSCSAGPRALTALLKLTERLGVIARNIFHVFSAEAGWGLAVDGRDVGGQKYVADVDPLVAGGGSHDLTDGAFPATVEWRRGPYHA